MRTLLSTGAACLAVLAVLASAPRASAFCRTTSNGTFVPTVSRPCDDKGDPLYWATSCVGFSVQRAASVQIDLPTAQRVVADAFAVWSTADCGSACAGAAAGKPSISAKDLGPVDCADVEYSQSGSNANLVVFRDGDWPNDGIALALTTVTYKIDGGQIYDADVEVQSNPAVVKLAVSDPVPLDAYDLRSILTHEFGHVFGLAHTQPANTTSTMFERYRAGQTFMRDLAADDACAICSAYPATRAAICDASPMHGLGNTCGGGEKEKGCGCTTPGAGETGGGALAALALGAVWAMRRRRR